AGGPWRGTTGVGDIASRADVGRARMGEGEVLVGGERRPAASALEAAGLPPLRPYAKDALTILSSNAYAAGRAALVLDDLRRVLDAADAVFALSLEGLNGNLSPVLPPAQRVRPYEGQARTAARVRALLAGSHLARPHPDRALQDPLSFRDFSQVQGAARDLLAFAAAQLRIQLNSSDDNPAVVALAAGDPDAASVPTADLVAAGDV